MTFHSVTKPLLFFCAGNIQQHLKTDLFRRAHGGLIYSMPVSGSMFLMGTLAVTGTAPFSIFQSEFTILRAAFERALFVPATLCVALLGAIFTGFLVHVAKLVLGADPGLPPAAVCRWKRYPLMGLGTLIVILGFWLPSPVFHLIQNAARIASGEP